MISIIVIPTTFFFSSVIVYMHAESVFCNEVVRVEKLKYIWYRTRRIEQDEVMK